MCFSRDIEAHLVLFIFIPGLLFESAFDADYHTFSKEMNQALLLAGPGVVVNTFLTGILMKYCTDYAWSWSIALMFGAIVSVFHRGFSNSSTMKMFLNLGFSNRSSSSCSIIKRIRCIKKIININ